MASGYRVEKLIRDRIPDIIREAGERADIRRVDDDQVRPYVAWKLIEEAFEAFWAFTEGNASHVRTELADVLEVVMRLLNLAGLSWDDLLLAREERLERRGAFEGNYLLADPPNQRHRLYEGYSTPLLEALRSSLRSCTQAHLAVSFVMKSGVELLLDVIQEALSRGVRVRLLTSDYLDITEPEALERLASLPEGFEMRAYQEPSRSFHPKVYIFEQADGRGKAFIGSSNLSASALRDGIEWNYQIQAIDEGWPLAELLTKYDSLFYSDHSVPIDAKFIAEYKRRRRPRTPLDLEPKRLALTPRPAQIEALSALNALREEGERKAMVIAATGIGKTYLAAFDSQPYARVLVLAHRDELLTQARDSFRRVRPDARLGFYRGGEHTTDADIVFASVSTLGRSEHLKRFAPDYFDYIVVDEFHHAAAKSYQAILHYFAPKFLLGLTATPYRADNRDVFALCEGNVAYKVTFMEAIALGWLAPFHYFGKHDETDYSEVPWRNGRYDEDSLSRAVETDARAEAILKAYQEHPSRAAVGFCVSIQHARFMAAYFTAHHVPALAVHSGSDSVGRAEAIARLRDGRVKVLFTVDLFNEGVDIPEIDMVLFLRPTESPTIFLQQLGRGLRLHEGKAQLTALDFIGNYRKAHYKIALIAGREEAEPEPAAVRRLLEEFTSGELALPEGVRLHFDLQAINLMQQFASQREPWRQRLESGYQELYDDLGHRPDLLELHRHGRFDVRQYRQAFGSWYGFFRAQNMLRPEEEKLDDQAGEFLLEIEKTSMTKCYKMVILKAFLDAGGLEHPVGADDLLRSFRGYFEASPRHLRDLLATEVEDIQSVPDEKLGQVPGRGVKTRFSPNTSRDVDFRSAPTRLPPRPALLEVVGERGRAA